MDPSTHARETSGVTSRLVVGYVREHGGPQAVDALLRRADVPHSRSELEDESRWVSYATRIRLFEAAVEVLGDPDCTYAMGATSLRAGMNHSLFLLMRALGSPSQVYRQLPRAVPKFSTTSTMEVLECSATHAVLRYTLHEGYRHSHLDCRYAQGLISMIPQIFGLPPAELVHDACESLGAPACLYRLRWSQRPRRLQWRHRKEPGKDLELAALRGQLQQLQTTASELVGSDELDVVLGRITERAAAAVLAPAYLLAVVDPQTGRPMVHSKGIPASDVDGLAEQLLAGQDLGAHVVAVEVRSARRLHGRLAAIYPPHQQGPADERAMLTAYAGYAAATLDLLLALETSRRGESRSADLLALAHQLRSASDAQTVAEVVVAMLPQIVDCDTTSVLGWDAEAGQLRALASNGLDERERERLHTATILADETPELVDMLTRHETAVIRTRDATPALRVLLEELQLEGFAVTPLLADETLLGVATACWRPGRMPADLADVVSRLDGVGEYGATALQNARLWSTVRHQSLHDALTGLPNRVVLSRQLEQALADAGPDQGVTVLFCDLDRFKHVNDTLGHAAGDELLRQVAARLRAVLRPGDVVGRLSGDEFAVVLPGVADAEAAGTLGDRVLACFTEPFRVEGRELRVTTSVGVATHVGVGGRVDELLRAADAGMYDAKQRGRSQLGYAPATLRSTRAPRTTATADHPVDRLEVELRGALARGELRAHFQPVVELPRERADQDGDADLGATSAPRLVGAEALVRWQHPRLGLVPPGTFLPVAEEAGISADLDLWVVDAACSALASWTTTSDPLHVAVNLSTATLLDARLHETLRSAIARHGLAAEQLLLEVVETRALHDVPAVAERLTQLRRLGVRISLDDFGTGYSTLSWLQSLPVDQIKVDRSFTADISGSRTAQAVVRAVTTLGRDLGVDVVAEGVETTEQLRRLREAGCRTFQGYLFGRPSAQPPALDPTFHLLQAEA